VDTPWLLPPDAEARFTGPMCGRFDTSHLYWRDIHDQLSSLVPVRSAPDNMEPTDDARPTDPHLVARLEADGFVLERMRWGLIPRSYKGKRVRPSERGAKDGFQLTTFNCRVEPFTGEEDKVPWTYKFAFAERRCIVPAMRWYEWTGAQGKKTKHAFARADGKPLWFAGIWDQCDTADMGAVRSFTIMTGKSAGVLADYHTRAPVILEPEDFSAWLDPAQDTRALLSDVRPDRFLVELAA
jgi:putative SOS response-associated peptidase YedK